MGLSDFLFGEQEAPGHTVVESFPGAAEMRQRLAEAAEPGALSRITGAGGAYGGPLVAPFSDLQQRGFADIESHLGRGLPTDTPMFQAAQGELMRTLGGEEYDPYEGEYYRAYRENIQRELQEAKDRLAARASSRDMFYGGGRRQVEGELEETAMGQLQQMLGSLYEAERERRRASIPQALGMLSYQEGAPVARAQTALQAGGMQQALQQMQLDADYQEWLRQQSEMGIPLDVAMGMSTYTPGFYQEQQPYRDPAEGFLAQLGGISQLASGIAPMFGAGMPILGGLFGGGMMPVGSNIAGPADFAQANVGMRGRQY